MSAEIDMSNGQANIAFVGELPWHRLGQKLEPDQSLEVWSKAAGLDWQAERSPVIYSAAGQLRQDDSSSVLYRSDTMAPLGIVGNRYKAVQPAEVLEFFAELSEKFHFQLETAGSLFGGKKIWALANTKLASSIGSHDDVGLYMLLATSFDGTLSTQARLTTVRVVCNNTLELATGDVGEVARVWHSSTFDANAVRDQLNVEGRWLDFTATAERMKTVEVSTAEVTDFLAKLYSVDPDASKLVWERFIGRMQKAIFSAPGADGSNSLWNVLNAVTFDVDHQGRQRNDDSRMNVTTFGLGNALKRKAYAELAEMAMAA